MTATTIVLPRELVPSEDQLGKLRCSVPGQLSDDFGVRTPETGSVRLSAICFAKNEQV